MHLIYAKQLTYVPVENFSCYSEFFVFSVCVSSCIPTQNTYLSLFLKVENHHPVSSYLVYKFLFLKPR